MGAVAIHMSKHDPLGYEPGAFQEEKIICDLFKS